MSLQPLVNYAGYEHVLGAAPCFVHPKNGNLYGVACEKQGGTRQNLSVYRVRPGQNVRELVKRYVGGVDSQAQIAMGGCVIHMDGSMEVWASAVPVGVPPLTKTGFQGVWDRVPGIDAPYAPGASAHSPIPIGQHITDLLSPTSATEMLYDKSYLPGDLDTPGELAVRISKQLFALNEQGAALKELIGLLKQAGVLEAP